jgi:hypothetical protein
MAITKLVADSLGAGAAPNQSAFKNLIINGDMSIAQRGTSVSSYTSDDYSTVDRMKTRVGALGTWTISQSTDVPSGQGFAKSLKWDCTTADASPSASDFLMLEHKIEGQNLQYLKYGTSSAETVTLSFWVKSNKTGTGQVNLRDYDNDKLLGGTYTINSSNTWEKKIITYIGNTSDTLDNDNAVSLALEFWLDSGSTYTGGTAPTAWETRDQTDRNASGTLSLGDNTANEWYITGVQLEAGTTASDFEFLPVDVNLRRCMRYFERTTAVGASDNYVNFASGLAQYSSGCVYCFLWKVTKRANPSMSATAASTFLNENGGSFPAGTSISFSQINKTSAQCDVFSSSGITQGNGAILKSNGTYDAYIDASSEL